MVPPTLKPDWVLFLVCYQASCAHGSCAQAGVAVGPETGAYPSHLTHWLLLACALIFLVATVMRDAGGQVPGVDVVSLTIALTVVLLALGLLLGLGGTPSGRSRVKQA